ncbi:EscI/YscI/HrpB family type III secretion system inner rod protein [Collimonas sp.]|uniref:EscI/YscI/HrpB family type III secretion system inner rod protein n=1 Tax=Collimonas sp. TaxID=1963772 RepID=UPI002B65DC5F|nr:EscI/YscI/HrpB family type III secretion system inner rod protein [Collimonas sp.]HWW05980.1 EscI/YscI/HrpB family type III secretion system inner rod protein [Collimonas sp.]
MNSVTSIAAGIPAGGVQQKGQFSLEIQSVEPADGAQFRAALERHMQKGAPAGSADNASLGKVIAGRATNLAADVKKDQQYVSKLLEQATRSGDSMQLMRAMMALNDYQIRVQTISKTVSKAASSVDSLTKLQ